MTDGPTEGEHTASGRREGDESTGADVEPVGLGPDGSEPVDILLVEDNPGDVRLTREALKQGRILVDLAVVTDGEGAVDFLKQRGEYADATRPNLVLLDLNLPKVDGLDVLETIQEDPHIRHIPVIVLTSSEAEEDVVRSYELQSNAYLTKPINPDQFIELVRTFEEFWFELVRLPPTEVHDE